jgi:hypothetical protein
MSERDQRGSSTSTTAIVAVAVLLLLGLPCLAVVFLFGTGALFWLGARDVPSPAPPPIVRPEDLPPSDPAPE